MRIYPKRPAPAEAIPLPTVPGLALCRPLEAGQPGPPWRAKDVKSGYEVVLRELADPGDAPDLLLARLPDHPHLLVPRLHLDITGRRVLATRYAVHRGLDQLLHRRAGLSPGEVSTVALAVGRGMAALHASGLVHGGVDTSAVLIGSQGRPFLDATSMLTRPAATSPEATSEATSEVTADVAALAALLAVAVLAPVPDAMVEALAPGRIDSAAELVRQLVAAAPPEPLRLTADADLQPTRPLRAQRPLGLGQPSRRRARAATAWVARPSGRLIAVSAAAALVVALAAVVAWSHVAGQPKVLAGRPPAAARPESTPTAIPSPSPSAVDWAGLVADLDSRRGEAFSGGDVDALTDVDAPGSAVLAGDLAALHQLTAAGLRASGFREVLRSVRPLSVTASLVVLRVVDARAAYQLVRASDGTAVVSRPARAVAAWRVELVLAPVGWQVRSVRPA